VFPLIRVLHILPDFGVAGAERVTIHLMQSANQERFLVGAISLYDPSGTYFEQSLAQGNFPVWYLGKRPGPDPRMLVRIAHVLRDFRPHVVHTHRYVLRYALPSILWYRIPAKVHTVHTQAEKEVDQPGRWIHRLAFRHRVLPVAISQEVRASLTRTYGIDHFPTIPHGIPVKEFRNPSITRQAWRAREGFAPEDVLFVCVARLAPPKNHALLLESFALGPASDPRAHLVLVGDGELELELKRRVDALGLRDKVHFLGVRSDIPETLNATDVFVLTSDWEGSPLSSMEAMAAGKPVICTAAGALPELVEDGEVGLVVPLREAKSLAHAMRYLLENPEVRNRMGQAAAKRATLLCDLEVETRAYEELYEILIAKA
jgi:glycosyltransferase involved in cell wall biosynthesis